ncbi:MAG: ATP-binding protein [Planctomycetota bacterium]
MTADETPHLDLTIPRRTAYLGLIRKAVGVTAGELGFQRDDVDLIELAVDEACSNAILYASEASPPTISVEVRVTDERFTVILVDGNPRYPFADHEVELDHQLASDERGGLGIYIIKRFMDEVDYECCPERGSVVTMTKLRPALSSL